MENQSGQYSISVIVPAYNVEGFLPRTLNSILEQTIRNIEIIGCWGRNYIISCALYL